MARDRYEERVQPPEVRYRVGLIDGDFSRRHDPDHLVLAFGAKRVAQAAEDRSTRAYFLGFRRGVRS